MNEHRSSQTGKLETYEEFVNKFKPKKTSDDCYTPANVKATVDKFVAERWNLDPSTFFDPFWPGGDYESEDYTGKIVVANPPFSILSKIVKWFDTHNVPFFLYANGLTLGTTARNVVCTRYVVKSYVTFENGARIQMGFISNIGPQVNYMETWPELSDALKACKPKAAPKGKKKYPTAITAATLKNAENSRKHIQIPRSDYVLVCDGVYGGGYITKEEAEQIYKETGVYPK